MSNMVNDNTMVLISTSELKEIIRETVGDEFKKVPYYSPSNESDEPMTLVEAAIYCKACTRTLIARVKEGKLNNGGTGRKYLFKKSELDVFLFKTKKK